MMRAVRRFVLALAVALPCASCTPEPAAEAPPPVPRPGVAAADQDVAAMAEVLTEAFLVSAEAVEGNPGPELVRWGRPLEVVLIGKEIPWLARFLELRVKRIEAITGVEIVRSHAADPFAGDPRGKLYVFAQTAATEADLRDILPKVGLGRLVRDPAPPIGSQGEFCTSITSIDRQSYLINYAALLVDDRYTVPGLEPGLSLALCVDTLLDRAMGLGNWFPRRLMLLDPADPQGPGIETDEIELRMLYDPKLQPGPVDAADRALLAASARTYLVQTGLRLDTPAPGQPAR